MPASNKGDRPRSTPLRAFRLMWSSASCSAIGDGQQGTEINIVERPLTDSATAYSRPYVDSRIAPKRSLKFEEADVYRPASLWNCIRHRLAHRSDRRVLINCRSEMLRRNISVDIGYPLYQNNDCCSAAITI